MVKIKSFFWQKFWQGFFYNSKINASVKNSEKSSKSALQENWLRAAQHINNAFNKVKNENQANH